MNILILGGGGREHALAWAVLQNPKCDRLIVAPGNAGIDEIADCAQLDILDGAAVVEFSEAEAIDLVIVGPEAPLAAGVADDLRAAGFATFGPSKAAARLEASKRFTKEICDAAGAPTAAWARFTEAAPAKAYLREQGAPIVVKADGLAAGKGVIVAMTLAEAEAAVDDMLGGAFGEAGAEVVIEEFMEGEEASFFVLCDGTDTLPIGTAQDHKRIGEGDTGPNTGGMGAYSPAPVLTDEIARRTMDEIVNPTLAEMAKRGSPYQGVLYVGLMIQNGAPRLVEYNVRFGDPECQVPDDAPRRTGARPHAGQRRGPPGRNESQLGRRPRHDRGAGRAGLSRHLRERHSDPRPRRPARRLRTHDVPRRHLGKGRPDHRHRRARPERHRAGRDPQRGPRRRLRPRRGRRLAPRHLPPRHRLAGALIRTTRPQPKSAGFPAETAPDLWCSPSMG